MLLSKYITSINVKNLSGNKAWILKGHAMDNDILSIEVLNFVLNNIKMTHPNVRLSSAANKHLKDYSGFLNGSKRMAPIDSVKLLEMLNEGATLIIDQAQNIHLPVCQLVKEIEKKIDCTSSASIYYSKRDATSFGAHFDAHDVLVIQLHGSKTWKIHYPTAELPMCGSKQLNFIKPTHKPDLLIETNTFDILYIPIGYWHEAFTNTDSSLHLSIILDYPRIINMIESQLHKLNEDAFFRKTVRSTVNPDDMETLRNKFKEFIFKLEPDIKRSRNKDIDLC